MRYQIFSLQQSTLIDLELNLEETLLLDWFLNWKDGTGMKREFIEDVQDIGYWIDYGTVVRELPIMFKRPTSDMSEEDLKKLDRNNKDKVGRLLKGNLSKVLRTHKIIKKGDKNKLGSMIFVTIVRGTIDKLKNIEKIEENKKDATAPTEASTQENKIDNPIIHKEEDKYTTQIMENENKRELIINNQRNKAIELIKKESDDFDLLPPIVREAKIRKKINEMIGGNSNDY